MHKNLILNFKCYGLIKINLNKFTYKAFSPYNAFCNSYSTKSIKKEDLDEIIHRIRNIGVIAHVDAGKTTTTERMLYYSGRIQSLGNVDDGNTVTDYMDQERERGITIVSAAITFPWKSHQFNLIDTPGHVDFNIEVERSLRVLDGAVTIIDASAGVEAQTLSVWRQSNKYRIPRIVYVNKMDKLGADFQASIKSIEEKLNTVPLVVQLPVGEEKSFCGVIDLVNMKKLLWSARNESDNRSQGKQFDVKSLEASDEHYEMAVKSRARLVEKLAQANETFAEILLDQYNMEYEKVNDSILIDTYVRQACLSNSATPVLCGSSFKNIAVQPLMDAIVKYLPNPLDLEKNNFDKYFESKADFVGVCFKIIHDHFKQRKRMNADTATATLQASGSAGSANAKSKLEETDDENVLAFVRVYNGELHHKSKIYNVNKQVKEEIDRIYIPFSNQIKIVNKVSNGNIALVSGLSKTITGDFLVSSKHSYDKAHDRLAKDSLTSESTRLMEINMDVPPPVFFCTVEPASDAEEKRLIHALGCLQREDPSLKVLINEEENMGQTLIQGMGELHLEIIKDRLLKEYKLNAFFGPLNIAYKEMPTQTGVAQLTFERQINDKKNYVQLEIEINPRPSGFSFESVELNLAKNEQGYTNNEFPREYLESINNGVKSALNNGILLRYPIVNCVVRLNAFSSNSKVHLPYISSAAYQCAVKALKNAECVVSQPIMQIEIATTNEYSSKVYGDLSRRHAQNIRVEESGKTVNLSACVPLSQLTAYSSELRRLTSGNTTFTIEFKTYEVLSQKEYQELIAKRI